jgi:hypothetical protein
MPLSKPQQTISNSKTRFRVVVAGRRFGKTFLAMHEIAKVARFPNRNVYCIYPTYKQAKKVLWKPLRKKMIAVNWVAKINETELTIELKNGTFITLVGADNFDSLRGVGLDAAILDEFQMLEKEAWNEVIRPALSDRQGSALFIGTPNGVGSFAHELYNKGKSKEKGWESFTYTTIEGGNVTQEEIDQAKQDLDLRTFLQEYCASFETYSNACYYAFSREETLKPFTNPTPKTLHIGMDFNRTPLTAAIFDVTNDTMHLFDEISMNSSNTDEMVEEIRNRYPNQHIVVYPDPSGKRMQTSSGGRSDHTILTNAGFAVKAPHKHNPVRDGINAVNSKLKSSTGKRTLFIDPKCKKAIDSVEKYAYKEGTQIPDKDAGTDHFSDAVRYAVDFLFPIKKEIKPQPPQRFGVATASVYR